MIHIDSLDCVERHVRIQRGSRILNNGNAAPPLDLRKSWDAVV
jgi:hypothetical protein